MTVKKWVGTSLNKKQVNTITVANTWATSDVCTITIDNIDFVITVGANTTTANVATTIQQALSGTTLTDTTASCTIPVADGGAGLIPQFSEFTATVNSSVVSLTGNGSNPPALAGKPFTVTVTETTAGTGTATGATATTPTSQFHADQADNWSANGAPANGDTIVFDSGSVDVRWGLGIAIQPAIINVFKTYTGNIGLPEINTDNSSKPYRDYRTTYLTLTDNSSTTVINGELGNGQGGGRRKIDSGACDTTLNLYGRGTSVDTGMPQWLWKGSGTNTVNNVGGDLGIAILAGETATVDTIVTGSGASSQASTICGTGCTQTTVTLNGGNQQTNSAVTTATQNAGTWEHFSGTVTALTQNGGTFWVNGACTITDATIYGTVDLSKSAGAVTFTNAPLVYGTINDPNGKATFSAGYKLMTATAKVVLPPGKTYTPS